MTSFELRNFRIDRMTLGISDNAFGDKLIRVEMPRYTFAVPAADYERATNERGSMSVFINELKTRREVAMGMA